MFLPQTIADYIAEFLVKERYKLHQIVPKKYYRRYYPTFTEYICDYYTSRGKKIDYDRLGRSLEGMAYLLKIGKVNPINPFILLNNGSDILIKKYLKEMIKMPVSRKWEIILGSKNAHKVLEDDVIEYLFINRREIIHLFVNCEITINAFSLRVRNERLMEIFKDYLSLKNLSENVHAINFLIKNPHLITKNICKNPAAEPILKTYPRIDPYLICYNKNPDIIKKYMGNFTPTINLIHSLSVNKNVPAELIEKYADMIVWNTTNINNKNINHLIEHVDNIPDECVKHCHDIDLIKRFPDKFLNNDTIYYNTSINKIMDVRQIPPDRIIWYNLFGENADIEFLRENMNSWNLSHITDYRFITPDIVMEKFETVSSYQKAERIIHIIDYLENVPIEFFIKHKKYISFDECGIYNNSFRILYKEKINKQRRFYSQIISKYFQF